MTANPKDVHRLICLQLGIKNVEDNDHFRDDLGAESLDIQNIIAALEDKYAITIEDDEAANLFTVGACIDLLKKKLP